MIRTYRSVRVHQNALARPSRLLVCVVMGIVFCAIPACGDKPVRAPAKSPLNAGEPEAKLGGRPMSEFYIEHDRFLSVTDPITVKPAAAFYLDPDDEVYGVVIRGKARAYPIRMISYYHVVNDQIADIPIAVTY